MNEWEQLPLDEKECSSPAEQAQETALEEIDGGAEECAQPIPRKRKMKKADVVFYVVIAVLFAFICGFRAWWTSNYGGVTVVGSSMKQTLQNGDQLFLRFTNDTKKAERGDIIVVYVGDYEECASMRDQYVIKRLIAIGLGLLVIPIVETVKFVQRKLGK